MQNNKVLRRARALIYHSGVSCFWVKLITNLLRRRNTIVRRRRRRRRHAPPRCDAVCVCVTPCRPPPKLDGPNMWLPCLSETLVAMLFASLRLFAYTFRCSKHSLAQTYIYLLYFTFIGALWAHVRRALCACK